MPEHGNEIEIRRIRDDADEAGAVVDLWDRMGRETPEGGSLRPQGRRNLQRMLEMAAWHHQTFCLVALDEGRVVGFGVGTVDAHDGLLPDLGGEAQELYVVPELEAADLLRPRLAREVVAQLKARGTGVIRSCRDVDDEEGGRLWAGLGFEADMVVMSLYG